MKTITREQVEHARTVAARLSTVTDELNRALQRAEDALVSLSLGVSASVRIDADRKVFYLTFTKLRSVWGLFIVRDLDQHETLYPLLKANRRERILAAGVLEVLLAALFEVLDQESEGVVDATKKVENFSEMARHLIEKSRDKE